MESYFVTMFFICLIIWVILTSAFRTLVNNPVKKVFIEKEKKINILIAFLISHKSDIKIFLKLILNQCPKDTR